MKVLFSNNKIEVEQKETSLLPASQKVESRRQIAVEKPGSWIAGKQNRFLALYKTSIYLWKKKGSVEFLNHLIRFFRGERHNISLVGELGGVNLVSLSHASATPVLKKLDLYEQWIQSNSLSENVVKQQQAHEKTFDYRPKISILTPVYNTDAKVLEKMIESVLAQTYSNWELCLVNGASSKPHVRLILDKYSHQDKRIKIKHLNENKGIVGNSNHAIEIASGEFIALLDHDDELTVNALYENVLLLNENPQADIIYSDEDKLNLQGLRCDPHFKPDWSPDLFCSMMYTCHFGVYRKSLIDKIGGFREGFDGAQDYDLVLRLIEQTDEIYHIPKILYHWRQVEGSTSLSLDNKDYAKNAQIKAVSEHFQRLGIAVEVSPGLAENLLRVKRLSTVTPKVSIIIPTRDQLNLLRNCVSSILEKTTYKNFEIIIVDNASSDPDTLKYLENITKEKNITVLNYDYPFNFAAINNFAVKHATGEVLLFLNNDTEIISEEWLEAMVEHAVRPEVGVVGARLLYSNEIVQHAGVIIGIGGVAGHSHKYFSKDHPGYFSRAKAIQNLSAVTGACMMVKKDLFESLGGFDEKNLAVAFNDIDFCLRVRQKHLLVVYTPYAEMYHHESISRGSDETPEKALRFQREAEYMLNYWSDVLRSDPYYNTNLTLIKEDFSIIDVNLIK